MYLLMIIVLNKFLENTFQLSILENISKIRKKKIFNVYELKGRVRKMITCKHITKSSENLNLIEIIYVEVINTFKPYKYNFFISTVFSSRAYLFNIHVKIYFSVLPLLKFKIYEFYIFVLQLQIYTNVLCNYI
jgi:hypothetical protein